MATQTMCRWHPPIIDPMGDFSHEGYPEDDCPECDAVNEAANS